MCIIKKDLSHSDLDFWESRVPHVTGLVLQWFLNTFLSRNIWTSVYEVFGRYRIQVFFYFLCSPSLVITSSSCSLAPMVPLDKSRVHSTISTSKRPFSHPFVDMKSHIQASPVLHQSFTKPDLHFILDLSFSNQQKSKQFHPGVPKWSVAELRYLWYILDILDIYLNLRSLSKSVISSLWHLDLAGWELNLSPMRQNLNSNQISISSFYAKQTTITLYVCTLKT